MQQLIPNSDEILINEYLPHNFLAEKLILSSLLTNVEVLLLAVKTLPIEAFYFKNHQEIYKTIISIYEEKLPLDILTFIAFSQNTGKLEKIGGIKVVIELFTQLPNLIYFEDYIKLIKDKYIRRSLIKLGYELINSSYITNLPLDTILKDFENKLFKIINKTEAKQLISSAELLNKIFFDLKNKSLTSTICGLTSGFYELDLLTQGFQKSDLIVLAGRPSTGKTSLGLSIALNAIKSSKLPIIFFSLEMSKEQIIQRLLSMETNIDPIRLRNGKLNQTDWIKLNQIIKVISKLPLFIDDSSNLTIQDIRLKIKNLQFEQNQIGLVLIDYLQLIQYLNLNATNRVQELSEITRSLKTIAREFNTSVVALSQLSRNVENRVDKRPLLSDLRESGSIEQDADIVLMLYKNQNLNQLTEKDFKPIELIVAKQRNGPIGVVKLRFDEQRTKFMNNFDDIN
jgi:replicative DNA helicase